MVGADTSDDAAVYRINDSTAVILTVDFFTPIVDDPYDFGRIAAANACSDVYAMGGKPVLALNILTFPACLDSGVLGEILKGGSDKMREAGVHIVGGHTVDDVEPKYGFAVMGFVHPDRVLTNGGILPGDALVLTKPLGTGIATTAVKATMCDPALKRRVVESMAALNDAASEAACRFGAHASTDITGFGLLGHSLKMAELACVTLEFWFDRLPIFEGVLDLVKEGLIPGGAYRNKEYVGEKVSFGPGISDDEKMILFDPQTSGGLLVAISPEGAEEMVRRLEGKEGSVEGRSRGTFVDGARIVGRALPYDDTPLRCIRS